MEDKFLQEFLKTGLFDIGESDERLLWLKKAIQDLQEKFKDDISLLPRYTIVAMDPNIRESEPALLDTEKLITAHWESLRLRFKEMPRNIIRGVILNALNNVGITDSIAARLIYLAGSSFYPYAKLNSEKALIERLLLTMGEIAESNAIKSWSLNKDVPLLAIENLEIGNIEFNDIRINEESLKENLRPALNNAPSGHGPQHGLHDPNYKEHYLSAISGGIAKSVNAAFTDLNNSVSTIDIESPINEFFANFKKTLESNLKNAYESLKAVEQRSKLLWWKETLYSPILKSSYRTLRKDLIPLVMASDLNTLLPEITPISVDYLLKDTVEIITNNNEEQIPFSTLLKGIFEPQAKAILKSLFPRTTENEGRISITAFFSQLVNERIGSDKFKEKTGIDAQETITLGDLSVTILHELLIERIISE